MIWGNTKKWAIKLLVWHFFKPFQRQSLKMVKHTQTICRLLPTNCLSVFDHFVGLVLQGLTCFVIQLFRKNNLLSLSSLQLKTYSASKRETLHLELVQTSERASWVFWEVAVLKKITKSQEKHPLLGAIFNVELSGNSGEHLWGTISGMSSSFFLQESSIIVVLYGPIYAFVDVG